MTPPIDPVAAAREEPLADALAALIAICREVGVSIQAREGGNGYAITNERAVKAEALIEPWHVCAQKLADEVDVLVQRRIIDARSPAADALLDVRNPPRTERSDRLATLESERVRLEHASAQREGDLQRELAAVRAQLDAAREVLDREVMRRAGDRWFCTLCRVEVRHDVNPGAWFKHDPKCVLAALSDSAPKGEQPDPDALLMRVAERAWDAGRAYAETALVGMDDPMETRAVTTRHVVAAAKGGAR